MGKAEHINLPETRLLTLEQAAGYCGFSAPIFKRLCPVRPHQFGEGKRALLRYDRHSLDEWIDGLKQTQSGILTAQEALERMRLAHGSKR
jgi:predicted DNA-binding transcriptional regulator AlpA